jgi:hypothetical protein
MKSGCNTQLKLARNFLNKNLESDLSRVASQNSRNYWVGGYFLSSARKWGRNPDKEVSCNDSQCWWYRQHGVNVWLCGGISTKNESIK